MARHVIITSVAAGALALFAHTAAAQQSGFEQAPPFGLGRALGQVGWAVENCGGQLSPHAVEMRARAMVKDRAEFERGLDEGAGDIQGYLALAGSRQAVCSLVRGVYGRRAPASGLWND